MKTTIVGRQLNVYDDTRSMIGLKLGKLDKYFPDEWNPRQPSRCAASAGCPPWR